MTPVIIPATDAGDSEHASSGSGGFCSGLLKMSFQSQDRLSDGRCSFRQYDSAAVTPPGRTGRTRSGDRASSRTGFPGQVRAYPGAMSGERKRRGTKVRPVLLAPTLRQKSELMLWTEPDTPTRCRL